jgi:RimJ/RimL family protein N-acetyltransferase
MGEPGSASRLIDPSERFRGQRATLRLLTLDDVSTRYVGWLNDPDVARHLETRWEPQNEASIEAFVRGMVSSQDSYLFAIVDNESALHVGNLKIGPIHRRHSFADVSYFIGERSLWGRGIATDAIVVAVRVGFERLGVHRLQAGLYAGNVGSARALEKAGFTLEGRFNAQLRGPDGWEDHVWYGLVRDDWKP